MNSNRQAEPERMDILNYLKQSKHLWIIPAYGIFYMISFMLMEQSDVKIHMIHSLADDKIPFCPYFFILRYSARAKKNIINISELWV